MKLTRILMILLVGLFYGCEQDCTKTAIRKLPNIDERPECSNHIYSNLVLSEDMNFPVNLSNVTDNPLAKVIASSPTDLERTSFAL